MTVPLRYLCVPVTFSKLSPWPWSICYSFWFFCCSMHRSNHRRFSTKKAVLKNFAIFTGKYLCWSLLFNIVADLHTCFEEHLRMAASICSNIIYKSNWQLLWLSVSRDVHSHKYAMVGFNSNSRQFVISSTVIPIWLMSYYLFFETVILAFFLEVVSAW